ncbi:hypothetical protein ACF1AX_21485 [Streptomyces sp. NPDC014802]|uniref:hypothetical protein n=1 Tax=Streptomyces sp. NPDC014802 TaxID=3364917 RepID=UPI0036F642D1
MVSLDKTPESITIGRMRALIGRELRKNNLVALALDFGQRAHDVEVKAAAEHRRSVLEWDVCDNDRCWTPTRKHEDFCSEECWTEWHAKYEPEVLERVTTR